MNRKAFKEWTFASAFRDAFHRKEDMMDVKRKLDTQTPEEKAQAEAMLRELGYDF